MNPLEHGRLTINPPDNDDELCLEIEGDDYPYSIYLPTNKLIEWVEELKKERE